MDAGSSSMPIPEMREEISGVSAKWLGERGLRVEYKVGKGRCLVAARKFEPGENTGIRESGSKIPLEPTGLHRRTPISYLYGSRHVK